MRTYPAFCFGVCLCAALSLATSAAARVVGRLHVNGPVTNATAKIEVIGGPIIYIDPVLLPATATADADFILITHNHGDHQEVGPTGSINRIRKPSTVIYSSPPGVPALTTALAGTGVTINAVIPGQKFTIGGVEVETVPMYNLAGVRPNPGHPRAMNYVGYVVNVGGVRIYAAGDTERFPEMKTFSTDIALLPLGQTFTMVSVQDAVEAALDVRARIAIPYHYGRGEGTLADANTFTSQLSGRMQVMLNTGTDGFAIEVSETIAIAEHPASTTVAPGANTTLSVQATGAGNLRYQWRRNGLLLTGATNATLPITAAASATHAGDYEVIVTDNNGPQVSRFARLAVDSPRPGRLVNLSVRATARAGAPLIVGAVVAGGSKQVLVRGIGPALTAFGVSGAMVDPQLEVHAGSGSNTLVGSNNDWGAGGGATSLRATFAAVGAFDLADAASRDAALVATIDSGRTIHVSDTANRSGVALVELYDADPPAGSARLVNLSARNFADTGDGILIAGFVISGNVPKRLLIRGVGPRLQSGFGVAGALSDPRLQLYLTEGSRSTLFAANDNWAEGGAVPTRAAFLTAGAFDLPDANSRDAALLVTVPAGAYTAQVSGVGNTTGEALIEIYELP